MQPYRHQAVYNDFDALAQAAPGFDVHLRQLGRGVFASEFQSIVGRRVQVVYSRFALGMEFGGGQPPGTHMFVVPANDDLRWTWRGIPVRGTDLVVSPARDGVDALSRPGFGACTVSIEEEHLDAVQARTGLPGRVPDVGVRVPFPRGAFDVLRRLIVLVLRSPPGLDVTHALEDELPAALVRLLARSRSTRVTPSEGAARDPRARLVARARRHIRSVAHEAPRVGEIEAALGTSGRTLRRAFREHLGLSPKEYVHAQRLNGVRRALLGGRGTITDVAGAYGFWHMGQFAADYRRQFGELPSETVRAGTTPVPGIRWP